MNPGGGLAGVLSLFSSRSMLFAVLLGVPYFSCLMMVGNLVKGSRVVDGEDVFDEVFRWFRFFVLNHSLLYCALFSLDWTRVLRVSQRMVVGFWGSSSFVWFARFYSTSEDQLCLLQHPKNNV